MQAESLFFGESTRRSSQGRSEWLKFAVDVEENKMKNIRPANAVHVGDYEMDNLIQGLWKWQRKYTNLNMGIEVGDNLGHECCLLQKRVR